MSTYEFWEVLTRPRGQIPVYTRNCQLQLWEWRTGLLSLWTNLSRALVMSKCPQARSTGWCWQVNRFWAWAGGGISDLQTLPVFPPSFPGSSHSKSQSTFLIISACWLWTGDRDQHGDETHRAGGIRLQAGRRTKLLTSFCSSATNSFREKKKKSMPAASTSFFYSVVCFHHSVETALTEVTICQIQLPHFHFLVMFPLPVMLALRTGMNVSTSVYHRAQWLIPRKHAIHFFWKNE